MAYFLLLNEFDRALGSIRDHYANSPAGSSSPGRNQGLATKQWIAATEVRLNGGHEGTKKYSTMACRARSFFYFATEDNLK